MLCELDCLLGEIQFEFTYIGQISLVDRSNPTNYF
jgi:hypothetical protein